MSNAFLLGGGGGNSGIAIGDPVTGGTTGSVLFVGAGPVLAQDNTNFFWDDTNNRLGLGINTPAATLDLQGTFNFGSSSGFLNAASGTVSITAPGALTRTDDTNVTLTLGGSPATSLLAATSLTLGWSGQLSMSRGGTGNGSFTSGSVIFSNGTILTEDSTNFVWNDVSNRLGIGTNSPGATLDLQGTFIFNSSSGALSASSGIVSVGILSAGNGGTGQSSYTVGDILYASGAAALSKLADVATGNALISGGVATAPSWGKIALTTHISGILPIANGGTNNSSAYTAGSVIFSNGTSLTQDNSNLFWNDANNTLGLGTSSPSALSGAHITRGHGSIADTDNVVPSSMGATLTSYVISDVLQYKVYAFKTIAGTRIYSPSGATSSVFNVTINSEGVQVDFDAVTGAEGYRVLRNLNGGGYIDFVDTATNQILDDGDNYIFASGSTVTPTSYTSNTYLEYFPASIAYGIYTGADGYFGSDVYVGSELGVNVTPAFRVHAVESAAKSTAVFKGPTDGGLGTYGNIEARNTNDQTVAIMAGGNSFPQDYGEFNVIGYPSGAGGICGDFVFFNGNASGDKRVALLRCVRGSLGTTDGTFQMYTHHPTAGFRIPIQCLSTDLIGIGNNVTALATLHVTPAATGNKAILAKAIASQTATLIEAQNSSAASLWSISSVGDQSLSPSVGTSGSRTTLTVTGPAHTGQTASTETIDVNVNLARILQHATGAITTQRAFVIQAPTYSFVGASTITNAATLAITAAPTAGTNATLTNTHALWVQAGNAQFDGGVKTNNVTDSALTAGRVVIAGTAGLLADDADFTFATDTLTVTKIAATTFTGDVTISTKNIITDTTTGTKIGTGTTQKLGFWNATPVVQDTGWSVSNVTTDRTYDANATTLDEIADVLGTLINQLKTYGIIGA